MTRRLSLTAMVLAAALAAPAGAQDSGKLSELERKLDVLSGEIERLKLGSAAEEPQELKPALGYGPAASKVYQKPPKRISIGGYGEMTYEEFHRRQNDGGIGGRDRSDFLRAVLYFGYKFTDKITFNSELEFEHASTGKRGEVSVEMAQLDFRPYDLLGVRAGLLLMPVGLINEVHEPTTFHGVRRPNVESAIYPTTWRENGVGLFGEAGPVSYRTYLVSGLQAASASSVSGFTASSLRNGRSSGSQSFSEDLAWVGRVDVSPVEGVEAGGSWYVGQADHGMTLASVPITLWDVHGKAAWKGLELRGLYVQGRIGNVDTLNIVQGNAAGANTSVGSHLFGGYLELAYNVLGLCPKTSQYLAPFFRWERYDTQQKVPDAWTKNPANSRLEWTMGLTYKPIPQVAVKFDHQIMKNQAQTGVGQTNLGIGYIF